ncbi:hypothetical protein EVAR_38466_1 [Eumeta japonica]|uniref:Uncharacterized protein n=1 Tax=Eumeta variegata TaxID=151549 RepID=A0A4C1WN85_EUMVA|nr:hypothetical protein EVAR_38466_1 [Eumeta japonica]
MCEPGRMEYKQNKVRVGRARDTRITTWQSRKRKRKATPVKNDDAGSSLLTSLYSMWLGVHLHTKNTQMSTKSTLIPTAFKECCSATDWSGIQTNDTRMHQNHGNLYMAHPPAHMNCIGSPSRTELRSVSRGGPNRIKIGTGIKSNPVRLESEPTVEPEPPYANLPRKGTQTIITEPNAERAPSAARGVNCESRRESEAGATEARITASFVLNCGSD